MPRALRHRITLAFAPTLSGCSVGPVATNSGGPVESVLREKLESKLGPHYLELVNESRSHGLDASAEKHFRVVAVSLEFSGKSRIDRHRLVHDILAEELSSHVHALSVQAYTPEEWTAKSGVTFDSPECLGGGKRHGMNK